MNNQIKPPRMQMFIYAIVHKRSRIIAYVGITESDKFRKSSHGKKFKWWKTHEFVVVMKVYGLIPARHSESRLIGALKSVGQCQLNKRIGGKHRGKPSRERFGQKMRALRMSKGRQAKFVASFMGIKPSVLSAMEAGMRRWTPERVAAYETAIGVNPSDVSKTAASMLAKIK